MRLLVIILKNRFSLYKRMKNQRFFNLLDKGTSVYHVAYSEKEFHYLGNRIF